MRFSICLIFILMTTVAQARIYNTQTDKMAVYVRGSLDQSSVDNTLATESQGNGVNLSAKYPYKVSGELGMAFSNPFMSIRPAIEIIRPPEIESSSGRRASDDVELYTVKSELSILAPKISFDANIHVWQTARLYLSAAYGYAMLTGRNSYSINATGTSQFGGLTDFHEELTGTSALYEGSLGYESLLSDTTTFAVEGGYRSLVFDSVEYKTGVTNFQGSKNSGQSALNMNGKKRSIDLSGIVIGLSFRFWL